tara:strand:+ start:1793 stop:2110 length:318 start_codon:yes stop_codon:yes gene_type:complete
MSFIDNVNIKFEEIINNNIKYNSQIIIDITYLESNVISLYKKKKYNLEFDKNLDDIFIKFKEKYIKYKNEITNLANSIKIEYNKLLNIYQSNHIELINTYTYRIE